MNRFLESAWNEISWYHREHGSLIYPLMIWGLGFCLLIAWLLVLAGH